MSDNGHKHSGSNSQRWNENRNRQQQDNWNQENPESYGNAGNEYGYQQTGQSRQRRNANYDYNEPGNDGDYGNNKYRNYIPQNDDDRWYGNRRHNDTAYGTAGNYGSQDYNETNRYYGAGNEMSDRYEDRYRNRQDDRNRREDWGRARVNTGNYDNGFFEDDVRRDYTRYDNRNRPYDDRAQRYQRSANRGDRDWWDRTRDEVSSWFGDDDAERRRNMDHQREGGHKGKGPRDYKRSEDRIREDVCDRLTDDDYLDASNVQVQVQGDEAILTGTVTSREQKRRAEDIVESVSGIRNVENRIKVNYSNTSDVIRENGRSKGSAEIGQ